MTYAVIGASHDILLQTRETIDARIRAKATEYTRNGQMCSYKFVRTFDSDPDENKFLMPIHGHLSSTGMLALQSTLRGIKTCVVGSHEMGIYIKHLKTYLQEDWNLDHELLQFCAEDAVPRLDRTIKRGYECLGKPEKYIFMAGDIPLADMDSVMRDYESFDAKSCAIWLDFNAKERIFPNGELFERNYYESFLEEEDPRPKGLLSSVGDFVRGKGKLYSYKEPNVYMFSNQFDKWSLIKEIYDRREKGELNLTSAAGIFLRKRGISLPDTYRIPMSLSFIIADAGARLVWQKLANKNVFTRGGFQRFASLVLDRQVRATISHADPFRLKDVDAWHDLVFYRELFRWAQHRNQLDDLFGPTNPVMQGFNEYMANRPGLAEQLPLVYRFEEYAKQRAKALEMHEYLDVEGEFAEHVRQDERIDDLIDVLLARTRTPAAPQAAASHQQ